MTSIAMARENGDASAVKPSEMPGSPRSRLEPQSERSPGRENSPLDQEFLTSPNSARPASLKMANGDADTEAPEIEADGYAGAERPDDDVDEADIGNEDDVSSTTSLTSFATRFRYENGRRYHAQTDAHYFLPNDELEMDRLDLCHHLLTLRCDDRLHLAPIENPKRILDLGTGTGIWAIEMGDAYPSAAVLGIDLSPVQPNVVPPNVTFEVDDIELDWCFSRPFDYIHCRNLAGSIKDWPRLMKQAFKITKPGGWVEFQDFDMRFYSADDTYVAGCASDQWGKELQHALRALDFEPEPGPKLEKWVRDAGFTNVNCECLPIPVGTWPKDKRMSEVGLFELTMFLEGLEAISLRALTAGLNWSREQVLGFLPAVRTDLKNRRVHMMHDFYIVWAQKPLSA